MLRIEAKYCIFCLPECLPSHKCLHVGLKFKDLFKVNNFFRNLVVILVVTRHETSQCDIVKQVPYLAR